MSIEARLLRDLRGGSVDVREATADDAETMLEIMRRQYSAARANGPKDSTVDELRDELGDDSVFAYVAADGFVVYGWEGSDLVVYQVQAADADTARALWAVVGSGSSVAKRVYAYLSSDDPVHLLVSESVAREVQQTRWMLRCLDVGAAISGRQYAPGTTLDVPLVVVDAQVPDNCVSGRLYVTDGRGELVPGPVGSDAVRLGANGLSALYAGTSMSTLVSAGLAVGGDPGIYGELDAAFAGRPAYLLDYF